MSKLRSHHTVLPWHIFIAAMVRHICAAVETILALVISLAWIFWSFVVWIGPMSIDPRTQKVYGKQFPALTMRDAVRLQMEMLRESWRVSSVAAVVGGSMGMSSYLYASGYGYVWYVRFLCTCFKYLCAVFIRMVNFWCMYIYVCVCTFEVCWNVLT